jgi:hypothetical protein
MHLKAYVTLSKYQIMDISKIEIGKNKLKLDRKGLNEVLEQLKYKI